MVYLYLSRGTRQYEYFFLPTLQKEFHATLFLTYLRGFSGLFENLNSSLQEMFFPFGENQREKAELSRSSYSL